jgi:molybdate transport system substrate-binding protein
VYYFFEKGGNMLLEKKFLSRGVVFVLVVLLAMLTFAGCSKKEEVPTKEEETPTPVALTIGAAASLTGALNEIIEAYTAENSHITITPIYEGSGVLQKQIEEGAPMDIFISAATSNMQTLQDADLIDADTREDLLKNELVLIASAEKANTITFDNIADASSIAIGEVETVPAGKYAKQALEKLEKWAGVESKLVYQKDVKAVLNAVETGNADCGFVYKSDAVNMTSAKEVSAVPNASHDPIVYPVAIVKASEEADAAKAFIKYLKSKGAKTVFEKFGFVV